MHKILLSGTNIKKSVNVIEVIAFEIQEKESSAPTACVTVPLNQIEFPWELKNCVLTDGDQVIFSGIVESIEKNKNTFVLNMTKIKRDHKIDQTTIDQDLIDLLYDNENLEIPEVFCKLNLPYYDRISDIPSIVSIVNEHSSPVIMDPHIIKDSLKMTKMIDKSISKINLEIVCSWVSKVDGDIDITSKIANRFPGGKVNTLTPKSLELSWPRFGEKISAAQPARQSKYYVGHSRLVSESTLHMSPSDVYTPSIEIGEETQLQLKRSWYNHKFSVCFGYEQYRKETLKTFVKNQYCEDGVSKNIKINLKSVQEYLKSDYTTSFFGTDLGQKAYKHIIKMVALYMASSLRDTIISFSIPYTHKITCRDWVVVQGKIAKISSLKFRNNKIIDVEAICFSSEEFRQFLKKTEDIILPPNISKQEDKETTCGDIIHDIVVENDGLTQTQKLFTHLKSLGGKINQSNYKQLINKFLNENKTSITIITKPLKTQYCEHSVIELAECSIQ